MYLYNEFLKMPLNCINLLEQIKLTFISPLSLSEWVQAEKGGWGEELHTGAEESGGCRNAPENSEVLLEY